MKNFILNILAILWFFPVLSFSLLFESFIFITIIWKTIPVMLISGFPSPMASGLPACFLFGTIYAITGWIPAFRRCYYKLPWLYPLTMMLTMNLFIVCIAELILRKGFEVISTPRHVFAIILMIVQIIVFRLIMCWYLKKNPMILHRYDRIV